LWGPIVEELKNQVSSNVILLRILKLLSFYYHQIPNNYQISENGFRGSGGIRLKMYRDKIEYNE
jgi:hypothetical protein